MRWSLLLLLVGCAPGAEIQEVHQTTKHGLEPGPKKKDPETTPPSDTPSCTSIPTLSVDGPVDWVAVDARIRARLDYAIGDDDPPWEATLTDRWGTVPGYAALDAEGLVIEFFPDEPLAHDTVYHLEVRVCDRRSSLRFTTRPEPLDPTVIDGVTWGIPWSTVRITDPPQMNPSMDADQLLVQTLFDGVDMDLLAATATEDDLGVLTPDCATAFAAPSANLSNNPRLQSTPAAIDLPAAGGSLRIEDFWVEFQASPDELTDVELHGRMPIGQFGAWGCFLLELQFGATCVPCASGECILFAAEARSALPVPGLDLEASCPI